MAFVPATCLTSSSPSDPRTRAESFGSGTDGPEGTGSPVTFEVGRFWRSLGASVLLGARRFEAREQHSAAQRIGQAILSRAPIEPLRRAFEEVEGAFGSIRESLGYIEGRIGMH